MKKSSVIIVAFLSFLCCLLAGKNFLQSKLKEPISVRIPDSEELKTSYRAENIKRLTFGYDSFFSSLLWIRLLQEAKHTPLKDNSLSWEYSEVDTVTTLDPNFESAYHFGALFVSFFRRDKIGGIKILEKWVKHSPIYWKAHHMLGMHYFLELGDYAKAAPHIIRASQLSDAPPYIASLGVGLLGQSGASLYTLQSACDLFEAATQRETKLRLLRRIRGLLWHLQKQKWETALAQFRKVRKKSPNSLEELIPFLKSEVHREITSLVPGVENSPILKEVFSEHFRFVLGTDKKSIESADPSLTQTFENIGIYLQKDPP